MADSARACQARALLRNLREDAQHGLRIDIDLVALQIDAPVGRNKRSALDRHLSPPSCEERPRRRLLLQPRRHAAQNGARMAVVGAHPVRGIGRAARLEPDALRAGLILRMPAQDVVVAVRAQVQEAASRRHELDGRLHLGIRLQVPAVRPAFVSQIRVRARNHCAVW